MDLILARLDRNYRPIQLLLTKPSGSKDHCTDEFARKKQKSRQLASSNIEHKTNIVDRIVDFIDRNKIVNEIREKNELYK